MTCVSLKATQVFLITTLQETPTYLIRELGEIVRLILIYAQTMSLTYIYQHCTTVSVAKSLSRNLLVFYLNTRLLELSVYTIVLLLLNTLIFKQTVRTSKGTLHTPTTVVSYQLHWMLPSAVPGNAYPSLLGNAHPSFQHPVIQTPAISSHLRIIDV